MTPPVSLLESAPARVSAPAPSMGTHVCADGTTLATYRWAPQLGQRSRPAAIVYVLHGMLEHAGRYSPLAAHLTSAGYAVYSHDYRGHGLTARPNGGSIDVAHVADTRGTELLVADAQERIAKVVAENPDVPVVVLGHSLGTFVARVLATEQGRHNGSLSRIGRPQGDTPAPAFEGQDHAGAAPGPASTAAGGLEPRVAGFAFFGTGGPQPVLNRVGAAMLRLLGLRSAPDEACPAARRLVFAPYNARFRPTRTDNDWMCHLPAVVDEMADDPLCASEASLAFWRDVAELQARANSRDELGLTGTDRRGAGSGARNPDTSTTPSVVSGDPDSGPPSPVAGGVYAGLPLLFCSGADDGVSQFGPGARRAAALARQAGSTDVTCTLLPGLRHEILNIDDPVVLTLLTRWLDARWG